MRAIILAAGIGTRLRPLTLDIPKSLIEINGKPILERQIEYLREIGINEIIVLTGYLAEKFNYLEDKYGVNLIHNNKYHVYNNIYSMYLVREKLQDSYVIDADVYMCRNFLEVNPMNSLYFSGEKEEFKEEWILNFDENEKVFDIEVGSGKGYIMSGVSYWNSEDGKYIKDKLEKVIESEEFYDLYWDNIVKDNLNSLNVYVKKIRYDDWFEIDSIEDLNRMKAYIKCK